MEMQKVKKINKKRKEEATLKTVLLAWNVAEYLPSRLDQTAHNVLSK